ncbi:MAG: hypothetical protein R3A46_06755 [Thermomicrobiales bacterium]
MVITRSSRWTLFLALIIALLPVLAACGGTDSDDEAGEDSSDNAVVGTGGAEVDFAPEIGTIDNWYNGSATTLAALRGEPVLLVFWADY